MDTNNLRYFAKQPIWPLKEEWLRRICLIYEKYAEEYLSGEGDQSARETREYCMAVIIAIHHSQESMADEVTRNWRDAESIRLGLKENHERERSEMEARLVGLRGQLGDASEEFESNMQVLLAQRYPSLKDLFREIAKKKRMQTARNSVGDALMKMSSSLLKPETLIKIVEALK